MKRSCCSVLLFVAGVLGAGLLPAQERAPSQARSEELHPYEQLLRALEQERARLGEKAERDREHLARMLEEQRELLAQAAREHQQQLHEQMLKARAEELRARGREREEDLYQRGAAALDERRWDQAVETFSRVAEMKGRRADGALYWKAWALNKQGQRAEALAALQEIQKSYPTSRWLNDARALEVEVRQGAGQAPSVDSSDEELKLLALNALQNTDPEQAVPLLDKFLKGNHPPKLKERALFVLAQSRSPRSREVMGQIARGGSNPDLQMKAVKYLGLYGGKESRQVLADVYGASNDLYVKRAILHSFMVAGERERLLAAAKGEQSPELRKEAIQQLGVMGAREELWQLYGPESSSELKERILHSLFVGGAVEKLLEVARTEKDPKLRRAAIHSLGISGAKRTGDALVSLYPNETDPDIRRQIVQALFVQNNAKALVDLARKETDAAMKKAIVEKLSIMRNKEATDYMMELLNK